MSVSARVVGRMLLAAAVAFAVVAAERHAAAGDVRSGTLRVAVFDTSAGQSMSVVRVHRCLKADDGFETTSVAPEQIRRGELADFDVLILPGGSGSGQSRALDEAGREAVKTFVREGGGYVGICAGAYLATSHYSWSLHLLNAQVIDTKHWARGNGIVRLNLTPAGRRFLQHDADVAEVHYWQGPLLGPGSRDDLPPYEQLATYATGIAKNGAPEGVMIGTTAIARSTYGSGRVICYSPHPERDHGPHAFLVHGVRWAAGGDD